MSSSSLAAVSMLGCILLVALSGCVVFVPHLSGCPGGCRVATRAGAMGPGSHCHRQSHARSYHHSVQTQCFCTRAGLFLRIVFQFLVQGSEADGVAHAFPLSANNFILERQSPPCSHLPCRCQHHKNILLTSLTPRVINAVSKLQLRARVDFRVVFYENASFRPQPRPSWCCCGKPGAGAAARVRRCHRHAQPAAGLPR